MKNSSVPAILIWVLYGLTAGCCLFLAAMTICSDLGLGAEMGLVAGGLTLAILGGASFGIRHLREKRGAVRKNTVDSGKRMTGIIVESLLVVLMLIGMVLLRAMLSTNRLPWVIVSAPDYELAQVVQGETIPNIMHRGRELYIYMLRGCMFLLGNKPQTAVVLQLVLLVLAALSLYFGIRSNAGAVPAVTVVAFLGFGPYMLAETCRLSSFLPVLIVYGLAACAITKLPGRAEEKMILRIVYHILAGILIGFACYLDMAGITLLVLLTGRICFHIGASEDEDQGHPVLSYIACVVLAGLAYLGCHFLRSIGGGSVIDSVIGQLELYLPGRFRLPVVVDVGTYLWDMPVVAVLMAIGIFSFWISHRIAGKGVWLFTAAVLMLMQCFQMNEINAFNSYALLYLFCVVMAGSSVEDLLRSPAAVVEEPEEELEMIDPAAEEPEPTPVPVKPQVQYIENPLPLPKKKAHKVLDYDYEVADDDDFDIP